MTEDRASLMPLPEAAKAYARELVAAGVYASTDEFKSVYYTGFESVALPAEGPRRTTFRAILALLQDEPMTPAKREHLHVLVAEL